MNYALQVFDVRESFTARYSTPADDRLSDTGGVYLYPPPAPVAISVAVGNFVFIPVERADGYRLYRQQGTIYVPIATVNNPVATEFNEVSIVAPGKYRVVAFNTAGDSPPSNVLSLVIEEPEESVEEPGGDPFDPEVLWRSESLFTMGPSSSYLTGGAYTDKYYYIDSGWDGIFSSDDGLEYDYLAPVVADSQDAITSNGTTLVLASYDYDGDKTDVFYSTDGTNWTQATISKSGWPVTVKWVNGKFFLVGSGGDIFYSADGSVWTQATTPAGDDVRDIAYGDGLYVAVGENLIYTSADGESFIAQPAGAGLNLYGVDYGNNVFMVAGEEGVLTSSDGVNFNSIYSEENEEFISVIFVDDASVPYFVVVRDGDDENSIPAAWFSSDGTTLTQESESPTSAYIPRVQRIGHWIVIFDIPLT